MYKDQAAAEKAGWSFEFVSNGGSNWKAERRVSASDKPHYHLEVGSSLDDLLVKCAAYDAHRASRSLD